MARRGWNGRIRTKRLHGRRRYAAGMRRQWWWRAIPPWHWRNQARNKVPLPMTAEVLASIRRAMVLTHFTPTGPIIDYGGGLTAQMGTTPG